MDFPLFIPTAVPFLMITQDFDNPCFRFQSAFTESLETACAQCRDFFTCRDSASLPGTRRRTAPFPYFCASKETRERNLCVLGSMFFVPDFAICKQNPFALTFRICTHCEFSFPNWCNSWFIHFFYDEDRYFRSSLGFRRFIWKKRSSARI